MIKLKNIKVYMTLSVKFYKFYGQDKAGPDLAALIALKFYFKK